MIRYIELGGYFPHAYQIRKEVSTGLNAYLRLTPQEGGQRRKGGDSRG